MSHNSASAFGPAHASIPRNIAPGAGKMYPAEKQNGAMPRQLFAFDEQYVRHLIRRTGYRAPLR